MSRSDKARFGTSCKRWKDTVYASRSQARARSTRKRVRARRERARARASARETADLVAAKKQRNR